MDEPNLNISFWIIENLETHMAELLGGEQTVPRRRSLANGTLAALYLEPGRAEPMAAGWRDLPIEQIGELRGHKDLAAHIQRLMPSLPPGPINDQRPDLGPPDPRP
jgi:hypothetical protein